MGLQRTCKSIKGCSACPHSKTLWFLTLYFFWLKKKSLKSTKCRCATACISYSKCREQRGIMFQCRVSAELHSEWSAAPAAQPGLSCRWRGEEHVCLELEAFPSFCVGWANRAPPLTASHPSHSLCPGISFLRYNSITFTSSEYRSFHTPTLRRYSDVCRPSQAQYTYMTWFDFRKATQAK